MRPNRRTARTASRNKLFTHNTGCAVALCSGPHLDRAVRCRRPIRLPSKAKLGHTDHTSYLAHTTKGPGGTRGSVQKGRLPAVGAQSKAPECGIAPPRGDLRAVTEGTVLHAFLFRHPFHHSYAMNDQPWRIGPSPPLPLSRQ